MDHFPYDPRFAPPSWLADEVAERLCERLDWLKIAPRRILWLGPSEQRAAALGKRYRGATLTPYPASGSAKQSLIARWRERLRGHKRDSGANAAAPVPPELATSAELLLANLLLYHTQQPELVLSAWHELLAPQAPLFFTTFGPDTLKEVQALAANLPWPRLPDMHDLGDLLVRLRYAEPVMDMHYLTIAYQRPEAFLADWGAWFGLDAGRLNQLIFPLTLTVELVFGHAWRAGPSSLPGNTAATSQPIRWHRR